jgi:hypothetical protein
MATAAVMEAVAGMMKAKMAEEPSLAREGSGVAMFGATVGAVEEEEEEEEEEEVVVGDVECLREVRRRWSGGEMPTKHAQESSDAMHANEEAAARRAKREATVAKQAKQKSAEEAAARRAKGRVLACLREREAAARRAKENETQRLKEELRRAREEERSAITRAEQAELNLLKLREKVDAAGIIQRAMQV